MSRRNLGIFIGQSTSWSGVLRDQNGTPIDLTNYTLTWKAGDKDFLREAISLTEGDGITIVDAPRGKWRVDLRNSDTVELYRGLYVHQGYAKQGEENRLFTFGDLEIGGEIR